MSDPLQARLLELIDELDNRSLDDLREARRQGTYHGDPYDAPDDCETMITVTRGELRKLRDAAAALAGEGSPVSPAERTFEDDRLVRELMAWADRSPNALGKADIQSRLLPAASAMLKRWAISSVSPAGAEQEKK